MDTEADKEFNANTVGTIESEKSENDSTDVKSDNTNEVAEKDTANTADDDEANAVDDKLDNNNDENDEFVENIDKNDSDNDSIVGDSKTNDDIEKVDNDDENVTNVIYDIHAVEDNNNDENEDNVEAEIDVVKHTETADDDLPPPEPESEPPAEDPPSYEAPEDDTPAEPEPEPEPEPEAEPERPPSPDTVPAVVTSHNYHPRLCIIRKWPDFQGYGFNLHAEKEKKGQYIGLVDANSPAEDADLRKGDRIIEVNGDNIEDDTHQQVIQKIKAGGDVAKMLVVDSEADDYFKNNGIQVTADMSEVITCETRQKESSAMTFIPRLCHVIKRPDFPGYGFNLHAEKERGGQYIGQIDNDSPAQEAGLKEYDRIIEVNGENIENETHQQVIARIKGGGSETKLLVVDKEADNYYKSRGVTVTSKMSEVKFIQSTRPTQSSTTVTNGDSSPAPAPQPMRVFSRRKAPTPPGSPTKSEDIFTMSAQDVRNHITRKKSDKRINRTSMREKVNLFEQL
ncbi:hypothetical protein ACF0H5_016258 [Mactra antiquata]